MKQKRLVTPFGLRLSPELKQWLKDKVADNRRSLNSEIEHRLAGTRAQEERRAVA